VFCVFYVAERDIIIPSDRSELRGDIHSRKLDFPTVIACDEPPMISRSSRFAGSTTIFFAIEYKTIKLGTIV
jgi:hypothetical protein